MATAQYEVTGMTCAHCEQAVTEEVGQIPGVLDVEVSATNGRLVITTSAPVADEQVLAAVDEAGYSAVRRS